MDELLTLWIRGYPEGDPLCGWYWYWGGGETSMDVGEKLYQHM